MAQRFEGQESRRSIDDGGRSVRRRALCSSPITSSLEKRGFLGGMKRVVIEAEVNEQRRAAAAAPAAAPLRRRQRGAPRRRARRVARGGGRGGRDRGGADGGGGWRRSWRTRRSARARRAARTPTTCSRRLRTVSPIEIPGAGSGVASSAGGPRLVRAACSRSAKLRARVPHRRERDADHRAACTAATLRAAHRRHGELLDALQVLGEQGARRPQGRERDRARLRGVQGAPRRELGETGARSWPTASAATAASSCFRR